MAIGGNSADKTITSPNKPVTRAEDSSASLAANSSFAIVLSLAHQWARNRTVMGCYGRLAEALD